MGEHNALKLMELNRPGEKLLAESHKGLLLDQVCLLLLNDLPDVIKYTFCKLVANDCKIYGKGLPTGDNCMQYDLTLLARWSRN